MDYTTKEIFIAKENTQIFNMFSRLKDMENQYLSYIREKLGEDFKTIEVYPPKRKKFDCPTNCGNTYVWINCIYTSSDNKSRILETLCARLDCGEKFLIYQENNT